MLELFETIRLTTNACGFPAGAIGTIVMVYTNPPGYSVDFDLSNANGYTNTVNIDVPQEAVALYAIPLRLPK